MNYIEQIKGFWLAQEVNQLGCCEIAMYFHLLEVWNKTGWVGSFHRNNYKVMADLSIKSYKTLQSTRDRLQSAGLLVYKTKNGDANTEYSMVDLGKFYKGSGRGSGGGDGRGLGKGSGGGDGRDNINQTKRNQTKHSKSHSGDKPPVEKKKDAGKPKAQFWDEFIRVFDEWYHSKFGSKYRYMKKDFAHLRMIYDFLKKRSDEKKFEFTSENLSAAFSYFLNRAWDKDNWLRNNFTIANLLSQFNAIANGTQSTSNQPPTGAAVSAGSIVAKISGMPTPAGATG